MGHLRGGRCCHAIAPGVYVQEELCTLSHHCQTFFSKKFFEQALCNSCIFNSLRERGMFLYVLIRIFSVRSLFFRLPDRIFSGDVTANIPSQSVSLIPFRMAVFQ